MLKRFEEKEEEKKYIDIFVNIKNIKVDGTISEFFISLNVIIQKKKEKKRKICNLLLIFNNIFFFFFFLNFQFKKKFFFFSLFIYT